MATTINSSLINYFTKFTTEIILAINCSDGVKGISRVVKIVNFL